MRFERDPESGLLIPQREIIAPRRRFALPLFRRYGAIQQAMIAQRIAGGGAPDLLYVGSNAGVLQTSVTTAAIDTSPCDFIALFVSYYSASLGTTPPTVSDTKSNSYTAGTVYRVLGGIAVCGYRCEAPAVGSGHTFTASGADLFGGIAAVAMSGMASTSYDQETGAASTGGTTRQPGSLTPSQANSVLIAALAYNDNSGGSLGIDSGFTEIVALPPRSGEVEGLYVYAKTLTSASAQNPTVTSSANFDQAAMMLAAYNY